MEIAEGTAAKELGTAKGGWKNLLHGALGESVAPSLHGLLNIVPVGVHDDAAIAVVRHEDRECQILDRRVGP